MVERVKKTENRPLSFMSFKERKRQRTVPCLLADLNHAFPSIVDSFVNINSGRPIIGGDGVVRTLIEIPGSINGRTGHFEYIIEPNGMCNHRFFKEAR